MSCNNKLQRQRGIILSRSWYLVGIFLFAQISVCISGNKYHKSQPQDTSITCYQCNSEYDPRCGDPFDSYSLGKVNCSMKKPLEHMKDHKPVLCRKTVQKVQGHVRVVRGCGYITDDRDDQECVRRSGTHEVTLHYCSCTKSLCNEAPSISNRHSTTAISLSALVLLVTYVSSSVSISATQV